MDMEVLRATSDRRDNPAPWMFDLITRPVTPRDEPPLTTDDIPQQVLDGLFGTSVITLPDGSSVSPAHVWASADLAVNGPSLESVLTQGPTISTNPLALAGWLGDLSNALNLFAFKLEARKGQPSLNSGELRTQLSDCVREKASKAELLGDMDGLVLGRHWARHPAFKISYTFDLYYGDDVLLTVDPHLLGRPSAAHRFHQFLNAINPQLPITGRDSDPLVVGFDLLGARNAMPDILRRGINDLQVLSQIKLFGDNPLRWVLRDYPQLQPIEERSANFSIRVWVHVAGAGSEKFVHPLFFIALRQGLSIVLQEGHVPAQQTSCVDLHFILTLIL